ncbi:MAG: T9SS type A sorting domain-containing protein [Candidatus Hatepunaea meridiana]|nr:T9SS type A sorting domain-containing protein [Candidatus Hatepunaea meridiana]
MIYRFSSFTLIQQCAAIFLVAFVAFGWIMVEDASAYDKKVLFEDFTSTTCPPCASFGPTQERYLEELGDIVVPIAIHVWWPGDSDPWWQDNQNENRARVQYYGINSVPALYCDGTVIGNRNDMRAIIRNRADDESSLSITLNARIIDDILSVGVDITSDDELNNVTLFVALKEIHVEYRGVNNWMDHYDAMVKMIPGANGTRFSIEADETLEFELEQDMDGLGWHDLEEDNLLLICWVQAGNREVLQAEETDFTGYDGYFYGNVTNNMTEEAIEGAEVVINEVNRSCITDEDGFFSFELVSIESFTVNVTRPGYTDIDEANFTFDGEEELEVEIRMLHPELEHNPPEITVELPEGETTRVDVHVVNGGDGPLEFTTSLRAARAEGGFWDQIDELENGDIANDDRIQATLFFQNYFWVVGGQRSDEPNMLYKISLGGQLEESWEQASCSNYGWRDLTTDGEFIYAVDSTYIAQINPNTGQVTDVRIPTPLNPCQAVTWDAEHELFWVTSISQNVFGIDREGNVIHEVNNSFRFRTSGITYFANDPDDYKLYILSNDQNGGVRLIKCNHLTNDTLTVAMLPIGDRERSGGCSMTNELCDFTWAFLGQMQAGDDILRVYEASSDFWWLNVTPPEGYLDPSDEMDVHVDISSADPEPNQTYETHLQFNHNSPAEGSIWVDITMTVTLGLEQDSEYMPVEYGLTDIYPNPFNAVSNISFNLDRASNITLTLHDLTGRQITELSNNYMQAGKYSVQLNAVDWPSGLYMVRLDDGSRVSMKKVALLK